MKYLAYNIRTNALMLGEDKKKKGEEKKMRKEELGVKAEGKSKR